MVQQSEQIDVSPGRHGGLLWASLGQQPKAAAGSIQQTLETCRTNLATLAFVLVHNVQQAIHLGGGAGRPKRPGAFYTTTGKAAVNPKSDKVEVQAISYEQACSTAGPAFAANFQASSEGYLFMVSMLY